MAGPLDPFLGSSEAVSRFLGELDLAGSSEATVLLTGESGSGRTAAARRLHAGGGRSDGPFVGVNLAALAPTLVEAALFGHERGAFTDAHRAREGLFQKASGGTLVLEDVDLMPLEMQVKLLRALQERVVEPLGADQPVPIDVRVVATTSRDLLELVHERAFREDLFYRLAVVTLTVPPLRARRDDLDDLARHLLLGAGERASVRPRELSPGALERLREHSWPGNVRELENALERVLVLGESGEDGSPRPVQAEELVFLNEANRGVEEEVAVKALSHGLTVERLTRAMMERALEEQRGNVSAAARQVGLTRRAFDYRMARAADAGSEEEGLEA
jgi:DNA-binding NtrC family response regulator